MKTNVRKYTDKELINRVKSLDSLLNLAILMTRMSCPEIAIQD